MVLNHLKIDILFFLILSSAAQTSPLRCMFDVFCDAYQEGTGGKTEDSVEKLSKIDIADEYHDKTTDDYGDRGRKEPSVEDNKASTELPPKHDFEHSGDNRDKSPSDGPTNNFHFTFNIVLSHNESKIPHNRHEREEKPPSNTSNVNATKVEESELSKKMSITPPIRHSVDDQDKYVNDVTNYSDFTANIRLGHNESKVTHHIHHEPKVNATGSIAPQVEGSWTSKKMSGTVPIGYSDDSQDRYAIHPTRHLDFDFLTDYFSPEILSFFYSYHTFLERIAVVIVFMVLWILYMRFKSLEKKLENLKENRNQSEDSEHIPNQVEENTQKETSNKDAGHIGNKVVENTQDGETANSEYTKRVEHTQEETLVGGLLLPSVWTADKVYHYLKLFLPDARSSEEKKLITDEFLNEVSSYIADQENVLEILTFMNQDALFQLGKFHHSLGWLQAGGVKETMIRVVVNAKEELKKKIIT